MARGEAGILNTTALGCAAAIKKPATRKDTKIILFTWVYLVRCKVLVANRNVQKIRVIHRLRNRFRKQIQADFYVFLIVIILFLAAQHRYFILLLAFIAFPDVKISSPFRLAAGHSSYGNSTKSPCAAGYRSGIP
jgi:hypothetical protein